MNDTHPLKQIAISFSGGGYRAAAYNLGVLSYLNHVQAEGAPLLKQVTLLSTISGGTITGMKYALCLAQGKSFDVFFEEMYQFMEQDFIMDEAFKMLNTPQNWAYKTKRKNLINAFSEIYQHKLLENETFGILLDCAEKTQVEFMFNATDLGYALPFRFQTSGKFGNKYRSLPLSSIRSLRLGDIVAASSCFPGGFEPLIMPADFFNTHVELQKALPNTFSIMDGGIVDNQGIESIWLAEDRNIRKKRPPIGTYIVSDVAHQVEPEAEAAEKPQGLAYQLGRSSLGAYYFWVLAIFYASLLLILLSANKWVLVAASIALSLTAILVTLNLVLRSRLSSIIKKLLNQNAPKVLNDFEILSKISLNQFFKLLQVRVLSLIRLNDAVFLGRLRQLHSDMNYEDPNWNFRIVSNLIYDLPKQAAVLSPALKTSIENANKMGTTLWFSDAEKVDNQMLHDLIICGQATICANLKKHFERRLTSDKNPVSPNMIPAIEQIIVDLTNDFQRFNKKPDWLLHK